MARRRAPELPALGNADGIPPELLVGRCIEVWAVDDGRPAHWSAMRRWSDARAAWLAERGLAKAQGHIDWHATRAAYGGALFDHTPWSIRTLDDECRGEYVDARLARAGVHRSDVPALQAAALRRLGEL